MHALFIFFLHSPLIQQTIHLFFVYNWMWRKHAIASLTCLSSFNYNTMKRGKRNKWRKQKGARFTCPLCFSSLLFFALPLSFVKWKACLTLFVTFSLNKGKGTKWTRGEREVKWYERSVRLFFSLPSLVFHFSSLLIPVPFRLISSEQREREN